MSHSRRGDTTGCQQDQPFDAIRSGSGELERNPTAEGQSHDGGGLQPESIEDIELRERCPEITDPNRACREATMIELR
jgi:hypothetical protein